MFGRRNQLATIEGFGVRVKDEREGDRNHIVEVQFEVPLTRELADEIKPAMARDLFHEVGGEWQPKPEMSLAGFDLTPGIQILEVRTHPDLEPMFRVEGVGVRRIRAKKTEAASWMLVFTASWALGQDVEVTTIIRALKTGVYITFAEQQPTMLDPGQVESTEAVATVAGDGTVTDISTRKRRRRLKPEQERAEQIAAGAAMAAEEPAEDAGDGDADDATGLTVN